MQLEHGLVLYGAFDIFMNIILQFVFFCSTSLTPFCFPFSYQSYPGDAPAHLLAGAYVTPNMYTPVTDQSVLNLIGNGTSVVQVLCA